MSTSSLSLYRLRYLLQHMDANKRKVQVLSLLAMKEEEFPHEVDEYGIEDELHALTVTPGDVEIVEKGTGRFTEVVGRRDEHGIVEMLQCPPMDPSEYSFQYRKSSKLESQKLGIRPIGYIRKRIRVSQLVPIFFSVLIEQQQLSHKEKHAKERNQRERLRMHRLNNAFEDLRNRLPSNAEKTISKKDILLKTIEYIGHLNREVDNRGQKNHREILSHQKLWQSHETTDNNALWQKKPFSAS